MTEKVHLHDVVVVDYTGAVKENGLIFDTTLASVAKQHNLPSQSTYAPVTVCVGEHHLLPGFDAQLVDKEMGKEYTITLQAEEAFGKRDVKRLRIIPLNTFREHKTQPMPGLQIDVDGEIGTVTSVSGGRVIVNFNHPLAGKDVVYTFTITRKITDVKEKIVAYLERTFRLPADKVEVTVQFDSAVVSLPLEFPGPLQELISKKLQTIAGLKTVTFEQKMGSAVGSQSS